MERRRVVDITLSVIKLVTAPVSSTKYSSMASFSRTCEATIDRLQAVEDLMVRQPGHHISGWFRTGLAGFPLPPA